MHVSLCYSCLFCIILVCMLLYLCNVHVAMRGGIPSTGLMPFVLPARNKLTRNIANNSY